MATKPKTIKTTALHRSAAIERAGGEADGDRSVAISFSSEEPVGRYFGREILDHRESSIRLDWFRSGNAPLLLEHDRDQQIGVIDSVSLGGDRKGRAVVRFGRSALAQEVLDDVRDGVRRNISVAYRLHEMVLEKSNEDEGDTFRAVDWEPLEVSIVSVPADQSVGLGRGDGDEFATIVRGVGEMADETKTKVTEEAAPKAAPAVARDAELKAARDEARTAEQTRIRRIQTLARHFDAETEAATAIKDGTSYEDFSENLLSARQSKPLPAPRSERTGGVDLTEREVKEYSLMKAIRALANPADARLRDEAGFEFEVSDAARKVNGQSTRGNFVVPLDVMARGNWSNGKRDLSAGTATAGGNLVATNLLAGSFIDLLRNRSAIVGSGAMLMDGLVGDVAIPKQDGGATAGWVSTEGGAVSEQNQTFAQVTMTPKTLGCFTDITRQLMLQSTPAIEGIVRNDLVTQVALEIDRAALYGSGSSGQPTGVTGATGLNMPLWGATPTWAQCIEMETVIASDNADIGTMWWIIPASTRGTLKGTVKESGEATYLMASDGTVNGYPHRLSNQVTADEAFFGVWSQLLIGMWGGLDLLVDPYTASTTGTVRIVVHQSVDVAVRHAQAFAYGTPSNPSASV